MTRGKGTWLGETFSENTKERNCRAWLTKFRISSKETKEWGGGGEIRNFARGSRKGRTKKKRKKKRTIRLTVLQTTINYLLYASFSNGFPPFFLLLLHPFFDFRLSSLSICIINPSSFPHPRETVRFAFLRSWKKSSKRIKKKTNFKMARENGNSAAF